MRVYALVSRDCRETVELFVSAVDAREALDAALRDEPTWRELLSVVPLELGRDWTAPSYFSRN